MGEQLFSFKRQHPLEIALDLKLPDRVVAPTEFYAGCSLFGALERGLQFINRSDEAKSICERIGFTLYFLQQLVIVCCRISTSKALADDECSWSAGIDDLRADPAVGADAGLYARHSNRPLFGGDGGSGN
jgi:hypothetical protein